MTPARRQTDAGLVTKCFRFATAPLVDGNTGRLSITRCLAVYDTALAAHVVERTHEITGTVLTLLIMAMAAAFGKSTFGFFLTRWQMKQSLAEVKTESTVDVTTRVIAERRNADTGIEATP